MSPLDLTELPRTRPVPYVICNGDHHPDNNNVISFYPTYLPTNQGLQRMVLLSLKIIVIITDELKMFKNYLLLHNLASLEFC